MLTEVEISRVEAHFQHLNTVRGGTSITRYPLTTAAEAVLATADIVNPLPDPISYTAVAINDLVVGLSTPGVATDAGSSNTFVVKVKIGCGRLQQHSSKDTGGSNSLYHV